MELERAYETFYVIHPQTNMLHTLIPIAVSFEEACNTSTKEMKPQCLRNRNDNTVEDLLFSNEPETITVDNYRGYSLERSGLVSLINLARLNDWKSAFVFSLRQKVGENACRRGQETTIL